MLLALLFLAPSLLHPGTPACAGARPHPNDGPDVDLRVRVREERVDVSVSFNLAFVDAIIDAPRADPDAVSAAEAAALRTALLDYLTLHNEVAIDGVLVTPLDRGFEVLPAPAHLIELFPAFGARALTKVQLELEYSAKAPPTELRLRWGPFPPDAPLRTEQGTPPVEVTAQLAAEGRDSLFTLTVDEPEFTWLGTGADAADRFLAVPALKTAGFIPAVSVVLVLSGCVVLVAALRSASDSALRRRGALVAVALLAGSVAARDVARVPLGGADLPSEDQARAVFTPLHANLYRAFDFEREGDVYDALARSVEGDLLDQLFDQVYRSLRNEDAGGAVSRVRSVEVLEAVVSDLAAVGGRPSFEVEALWQVEGAVVHWGHAHTRTNEYRARYGVRGGEQGWRIFSTQVLAERRVDAAPLGPLPPDGWEGWTGQPSDASAPGAADR